MSRRKKRAGKSRSEIGRKDKARKLATIWDDYWFGPVAAVRPYLLMKAALVLLAFDVWLLRIPRSWSRGIDGFNVAHFGWLEWLPPAVTPGLDVGLQLAIGILALVCVFSGAGLGARALLAVLYTYSWAMSMLDDFQHHYFLSLMLITFVFFPRVRAVDLYPTASDPSGRNEQAGSNVPVGGATVGAWAYVLLGVNVAIVYFFTAVNKLEPAWRQGIFIERMAREKNLLGPLEAWFTQSIGSKAIFWQSMASGVIAAELFIAAGFLLAGSRDRNPGGWRGMLCVSALLVVIGFNGIGNELVLSLRIGWFSYYMILLAGIYFLPAELLWKASEVLSRPGRKLTSFAAKLVAEGGASANFIPGFAIAGSAAIMIWVYFSVAALDLPGASIVGFVSALALLGVIIFSLRRGEYQKLVRYSLATGLATLVLWAALSQSPARFYFYYSTAAHLRMRDQPDAAREASEKAVRYLPPRRKDLLEFTDQKLPEDQ